MSQYKLERYYNAVITIYRLSSQSDKYGGVQSEWAKTDWDIRCRIFGEGGTYMLVSHGQQYPLSHKMVCGADVDIQEGDKVSDSTGIEYYVLRAYAHATKSKAHHMEVLLSRM